MKTLKIESLAKGWHDRDYIMLHACFQLLKDCVEKENLFGQFKMGRAEKILKELYDWWLVRAELEDVSDAQDEEDQRQLVRLIKYRRYLWT